MAGSGDSFQEKTEAATPKRRQDSRNKGKVAKSVELNSAFILVFGLLILYFGGGMLASNLTGLTRTFLETAGNVGINATNAHQMFTQSIMAIGLTLAPIVVGLMLVGAGASVAQVGFFFTLEPMMPKWSKLNPLSGVKRVLFSRRSMVEMAKNSIKIAILGVVAIFAIDSAITEALTLMDSDAEAILGSMMSSGLGVGFKVGLAYLVLATLDFFYQRYEYEEEMKMTKQEVKEEGKMTEGDPMIKGRIRGVQKQIAYRRMMQDVPKADVVITNPTHYAVALQYDAIEMAAPTVVAKGADLIALKIRELAKEHGVPIVEDKMLARTLYKSVEIGETVPEKLFQAVAHVLAYIYRMKGMKPQFSTN